jgi:uncharacterized protein YbjT (DUF2867 family)
MKIRAIVTGATGMVGEGVLHECLLDPDVEQVLIINRKPSGIAHPKLKEIVHGDFFDIHSIQSQLNGFNACFFCMGVSSVGMKEELYRRLTYDITMHFGSVLSNINREMTFCYVSGAGTDSTETKGMWARVKGKTENDLLKLPFKKVYLFRPGLMKPTKGLKNTLPFYNYLGWLYPLIRALGGATTLKELGLAMIHCAKKDYGKSVLEIKDIIAIAQDK